MPGLMQVIGYHVVLEGRMLVGVVGEKPIEIHAGEIILLPRNDMHTMASAAGITPVSVADIIQESPEGGLLRIRYGGEGEQTCIICGFLGTRESFNPLLATKAAR